VSRLQLKIPVPGERRFRAAITDPGYSAVRWRRGPAVQPPLKKSNEIVKKKILTNSCVFWQKGDPHVAYAASLDLHAGG